MAPLRQRMQEDLLLAGLAASTQTTYLNAASRLALHYGRSPDQLTEEEVRHYLLYLLQEKQVSRGAFKAAQYGLRFLYVDIRSIRTGSDADYSDGIAGRRQG